MYYNTEVSFDKLEVYSTNETKENYKIINEYLLQYYVKIDVRFTGCMRKQN